ncbi:MAG: methyltransferase domain-containing protein [Myxococcota bacterium]
MMMRRSCRGWMLMTVGIAGCAAPTAGSPPPKGTVVASAAVAVGGEVATPSALGLREDTRAGSIAPPPGEGETSAAAAETRGSDHGHEGAHGPLVHRFGGDPEKWVAKFEGPQRDAWQKPAVVVRKLGLRPGMKVADVGAGTGYFMPHLSRAVGPRGQVVAVDIEPTLVRHMLDRAARDGHDNVRVQLALPGDPMLSAGRFHRILIVDTWHHIPSRAAYAKTLRDNLLAGGQVHVVDFKPTSQLGPPAEHKLEAATVRAELEAAGLTVEVDETSLPEQYIAVGTRP